MNKKRKKPFFIFVQDVLIGVSILIFVTPVALVVYAIVKVAEGFGWQVTDPDRYKSDEELAKTGIF